jgi:DNA-binding NtrC family response regulator
MMNKALVIDDQRAMADSVCQLLSLFNLEAKVAYGPRAAMLVLSEEIPDIVFVDINMPSLSGFEVMRFLKREPRFEKVPVVVVTADDSFETSVKAYQEGALAVVIKPASYEDLEKVLSQAKLIH